jgi:hypothetical protein
MRASTQACASANVESVGIGMPYSVPWPPGAVASVPAERRSARSRYLPFRLLFLYFLHVLHVGEHVQFGRDAEDFGFFQRISPSVSVGINQAGQQGVASSVNLLYARQNSDSVTNRFNSAVLYPDIGLVRYSVAVKYPSVADYEAAVIVRAGQENCRCGQQKEERHPSKDSKCGSKSESHNSSPGNEN